MPAPLEAEITLTAPDLSPLGRDRVRLLETIGRAGSISGAARAMGVTYKTAWDAVCAMNNLVGKPLVEARTGGRRGGGARLTPEGVRLVETFHRLEGEMARALRALGPNLTGDGLTAARLMLGGFMRTSARNALHGTVTDVTDGAVNAEVTLALSDETRIVAMITRESLRTMGLFPGRPAIALIKAPFVLLAPVDEARRTSARNRLEGTITHLESGAVNAEVTLDLGGGKTLCAIVGLPSIAELGLEVGGRAAALIDAAHIILAVD